MAKSTLKVVDTSDLTDADWIEINKLKKAFDAGVCAGRCLKGIT
jgi:hypothetical protein